MINLIICSTEMLTCDCQTTHDMRSYLVYNSNRTNQDYNEIYDKLKN